MRHILKAAAGAVLLFGGSNALATVVVADFEGQAAGTVVTNQFAGFAVEATNAVATEARQAMIFDTHNFTGGDSDLAADIRHRDTGVIKDFGNVLIISEDGDSSDPDDAADGGQFVFTFDNPVTFIGMDLIDINAAESVQIQLLDLAGAVLFSGGNGATTTADNEYFTSTTTPGGVAGVARAVITLSGSGAIDNVTFDPGAPVPVPGALPMMAAALLGGRWMRRRKAASAA